MTLHWVTKHKTQPTSSVLLWDSFSSKVLWMIVILDFCSPSMIPSLSLKVHSFNVKLLIVTLIVLPCLLCGTWIPGATNIIFNLTKEVFSILAFDSCMSSVILLL